MTDTAPYPQPDDVTQPFWDGIAEGVLRLQRCAACERYVFYPRAVCPHCTNADLEWVEASGRGSVYSFSVVHRSPPAFDDPPYVVALVDLDEGVRMMTRVVEVELEAVAIGQSVEVVIQGEPALPYVRPARG